jgi:Zn-dependent protease/CBS domain-containing protein
MFRHTIPIGRYFGISVDLDYSWFLILALLTWLLATNYFPFQFKGWSTSEYWLVGALASVLLFVSVLIHEFGHSLVALRYGIPVPRITLFIFGGVSQIAEEPPNAAAEFWIAIAGPIVSFALAALFWELEPLLTFSTPLLATAQYLALINIVLGVFNLIPGFPLDGGRVLRAILWRTTKKFQRSTAIAALVGRFFGFLLIFLGVWQALFGNLINGIWIAFIGWFLESAAGSQLQQEVLKNLVGGHIVGEAMTHEVPQVPPEITLQDLADKFVLTRGLRSFVVTSGDKPVGMITLSQMRQTAREAWPTTTVSQVMLPLEKVVTVPPDARLWTAFQKMGREGVNQVPVVDGGGIVGMLSREDLIHYLQTLQALKA